MHRSGAALSAMICIMKGVQLIAVCLFAVSSFCAVPARVTG